MNNERETPYEPMPVIKNNFEFNISNDKDEFAIGAYIQFNRFGEAKFYQPFVGIYIGFISIEFGW